MNGPDYFFPQLEAIASIGKRRLLQPGQQIIKAGEKSSCMYLVCTGTVSCRVGDREVKKLSSGHSFGDVAVYCDHIYRLHQELASILGDADALDKMYDSVTRFELNGGKGFLFLAQIDPNRRHLRRRRLPSHGAIG